MVPVTHVARVVVAASLHPDHSVAQVDAHPRLTMEQYCGCLEAYGYDVPRLSYEEWSKRMEDYVSATSTASDAPNDAVNGEKKEEHALLPLYHMVTTSLPEDSKAPQLDDKNAADVLKKDAKSTGEDLSAGSGVTEDAVGAYLAYLIALGFVPKPTKEGKKLPDINISVEQKEALASVGGRGGGSR